MISDNSENSYSKSITFGKSYIINESLENERYLKESYNQYGFDEEEIKEKKINYNENIPRIILMGLRRSGKTSIQKVVFQKMAPNETLFIESTLKIIKNGTFKY
jgi:Ras-related GTP-binding protein C/D